MLGQEARGPLRAGTEQESEREGSRPGAMLGGQSLSLLNTRSVFRRNTRNWRGRSLRGQDADTRPRQRPLQAHDAPALPSCVSAASVTAVPVALGHPRVRETRLPHSGSVLCVKEERTAFPLGTRNVSPAERARHSSDARPGEMVPDRALRSRSIHLAMIRLFMGKKCKSCSFFVIEKRRRGAEQVCARGTGHAHLASCRGDSRGLQKARPHSEGRGA